MCLPLLFRRFSRQLHLRYKRDTSCPSLRFWTGKTPSRSCVATTCQGLCSRWGRQATNSLLSPPFCLSLCPSRCGLGCRNHTWTDLAAWTATRLWSCPFWKSLKVPLNGSVHLGSFWSSIRYASSIGWNRLSRVLPMAFWAASCSKQNLRIPAHRLSPIITLWRPAMRSLKDHQRSPVTFSGRTPLKLELVL